MYKILKTQLTNNKNELLLVGGSFSCNPPLIIGVVHGDEPQGEELINQYLNDVENTSLLFIPCLNPDGKILGTRTNSKGVDINRNFPTKNWVYSKKDKYYGGDSPASEIETRFLTEVLDEYTPSVILTLHTPYKIVNYDGPAREHSEEISKIIGYPVEESIGYPTPGSFGTYAGIERNIPTITLEMDENININLLYPKIKKIFEYLEKH